MSKKYSWGMGIEHETALIHQNEKLMSGSQILKKYRNTWRPSYQHLNERYRLMVQPDVMYPVMIFFNAVPALNELFLEDDKEIVKILEDEQLSPDYHDFSVGCKHDPTNTKWLKTGSNCSLEFVTRTFKDVTIDEVVKELESTQDTVLAKIKETTAAKMSEKTYGSIEFPEIGAYRYVGYLDKSGKLMVSTNYFGSYHLNLTLPYTASETMPVFRRAHLKWAKLIQWIMPLLVAVYGTGDSGSFMDKNRLSEGSYRNMTNLFARPGSADLNRGFFPTTRKLDYNSDWLDALMVDLDYPESDEVGTDFRRDIEKGERFGFELRIFDHFPTRYLRDLLAFMWYLADHSHDIVLIDSPVNRDVTWQSALKEVLRYGWNAKLSDNYLRELRVGLNLPITGASSLALDVFLELTRGLNRLYSGTGKGFYTDIIYGGKKKPKIEVFKPVQNQVAQTVFIDNYFLNKKYRDQLNRALDKHIGKTVNIEVLVTDLSEELGKSVLDEIDDLVAYLLDKSVLKKVSNKTDSYRVTKKLVLTSEN